MLQIAPSKILIVRKCFMAAGYGKGYGRPYLRHRISNIKRHPFLTSTLNIQ
jgi:hypothetical protein